MQVGKYYSWSPIELKCFAMFMSVPMPTKVSNKDYRAKGTESCCRQGVEEMAKECVSFVITYI